MVEGRDELQIKHLDSFLDEHDLHLLADSSEIAVIGSIYKRDASDLGIRRIGDVTNFIEPAVSLPTPKKGGQGPINQNFRNTKSTNFLVKAVTKFISSIGFSIGGTKEELLEVDYANVTYDDIDTVTFSDLFQGKKLKKSNMKFDPESEYFVVTRIVQSPSFKVKVKASRDLKAKLSAKGGQGPLVEGQFEMEYTKGSLDEVTMTYIGKNPLPFAVHLEKIYFRKDSGDIYDLKPLIEAIKVFAPGGSERVWETEPDK